MCLLAREKEKVAESDISVVKVLLRDKILEKYFTPVQMAEVPESVINGNEDMVAEGDEKIRFVVFGAHYYVYGGFVHSYDAGYAEANLLKDTKSACYFRCVIPKGTRYWVSYYGTEYASKSLRFVKKC